MSCWGMGISQSDEYCETYDRFIEEYDKGKPVSAITKDILEEYLEEFSEDDGVLHDVYFALGKAEWSCGGISALVYQRIKKIVENDENIFFLQELGATEVDLKTRKKNLEKFLNSISVPKDKVRKRKVAEENYIAEPKKEYTPLPCFKDGDVLAYNDEGIYRIFSIVRHQKAYSKTVVFCYLWKKCFSNIPGLKELYSENIMPLGYFNGDTFPNIEKITLVGNMPELKKIGNLRSPELICKEWTHPVFVMSMPTVPPYEYDLDLCLALNDVLDIIEKL